MINILRQMKKFLSELMNGLSYFITHFIDWYDGLTSDESIFLFLRFSLFSTEICIWSPCFLSITEWIRLETSVKTTSGITLVCLMVFWDWWYIWSMFFNRSLYITFTWCINWFLSLSTFSLLFPQTFYLSAWYFSLLSVCPLNLVSSDPAEFLTVSFAFSDAVNAVNCK